MDEVVHAWNAFNGFADIPPAQLSSQLAIFPSLGLLPQRCNRSGFPDRSSAADRGENLIQVHRPNRPGKKLSSSGR